MNVHLAEYEYQVGGSLRVGAPSYVTRQADQDLYEALKARQFCYVLNSRQMGKSSLRVQTMHRLKAEGVTCIAIDMTRIGSEHITPQQWYEQVISELWRGANLIGKVNLKAWFGEEGDRSSIQLLIRFIEEVLLVQLPGSIVIFIDEIDSILGLNFSVNDFFALIRACYNYRVDNPAYQRLTFCLFGVASPSDLMTDKTRTPFNIGQAITLNGFRFEEAQGLAAGLAEHVTEPQVALQEILSWTGGQPFLTQKICRSLAESTSSSAQQCVNDFIKNWTSQDEPEHLRTIRDRLLRDQKLASGLLGLYQQILLHGEIPIDDSKEQQELRLSGLVVKQDATLKVYNPIYAAVFNQTWVETMLNNLRPYAEALNAWITSNKADSSRLLRGQALEEALQWSVGRNLSYQDSEFLRASQTAENQDAKQANQILTQANHKAKWMIRGGAGLLGIAVLSAGAIGLWSNKSISTAKTLTQLEKTSSDALKQFEFDQQEALLNALRATGQLKQLTQPEEKYPTSSPVVALQTILDNIQVKKIPPSWNTRIQLTAQGVRFIASEHHKASVWDLQGNQIASLHRHSANISSVRLSPDEQFVATEPLAGCTIHLWNVQGQQLATLKGQGNILTSNFSPNSQFLLATEMNRACDDSVSSSSRTGRLYSLQGRQLAVFKELPVTDKAAQFNPQSDRILTLEDTAKPGHPMMRLWDLQGKQRVAFQGKLNTSVVSATFSLDGQLIASVEKDFEGQSAISLWNVQGQQLATFKTQQHLPEVIRFSSNGQLIATGGYDGTIQLRNRQGKLIRTFKGYPGSVAAIQFSPNNQRIATVGETEARATGQATGYIWDLQGNRLDSFDSSGDNPHDNLHFSPDGSRILTTARLKYFQNPHRKTLGANRGKIQVLRVSSKGDRIMAYVESEGTIRVWNNQGKELATIKVGELPRFESGYAMQFNADGDRILTFKVPKNPKQEKHGVRVWNLQGQQVAFLEGSWWNGDLTPPRQYYASVVDQMSGVRVWDLQGNVVTTIKGKTDPSRQLLINRVRLSPSGNYVLMTSNVGGSTLWTLKGQQLAEIEELKFQKIFFSNDEQRLIALQQYDSIARQWNLQGKPLKPIKVTFESEEDGYYEVPLKPSTVFNAKADLFVTANDRVFLWNLQRGQIVELDARTKISPFNDPDQQVQMSDRGNRIATLGQDNKVRVWDNKGNQLAEHEGYKMALSADGKQIVVVSQADNIPRVWQVSDVDGLLKRGCDWLRLAIALDHDAGDRRLCDIDK
ncbi:AAA-like domain-containing protein [Phormidium sp. FACHB-592]|uniref:AAA-like domain-containing protein n=1 Tax=Stenomitos frigidus AS-A4 TaxID=2933935 RepID=A0ABV0KKH5_9CYAN|nr:AAA-like domain-containing protein [Phormidium sp. FACHB-592]MBD2077020.1 AAA-like domain-containing protein [Phormidium sp. FACHB-592]